MSNTDHKNTSSKIKIAFFDADGTIYHMKTGIARHEMQKMNTTTSLRNIQNPNIAMPQNALAKR